MGYQLHPEPEREVKQETFLIVVLAAETLARYGSLPAFKKLSAAGCSELDAFGACWPEVKRLLQKARVTGSDQQP